MRIIRGAASVEDTDFCARECVCVCVCVCVSYINKLAQKFCVRVRVYIGIYNTSIGPSSQLQ
jgi:hypothetical protein